MTSVPLRISPSIAKGGDALSLEGSCLTWLIVSIVALGMALQVNYGQFHPAAIGWLSFGSVSLFLAMRRVTRGSAVRLDRPILAGAILLQCVLHLGRNPGIAELGPVSSLFTFQVGIVLGTVAALAAVFTVGRLRSTAIVAMLLVHLLLGLWTLRALPTPPVDVLTFQRDASAALLQGKNPYAITFPDESPAGSKFYGDGLSENGQLLFGYPYPPIALLLTLPAHLAGDVRLIHLVALTLGGALIAFSRPGWRASGAAAVLLFTPRGYFVLQAGWIEPIVELGLASVVFIACRVEGVGGRTLAAAFTPGHSYRPCATLLVVLGLFLTSKQYLILALPACLLLPGVRSGLRTLGGWIAFLAVPLSILLAFALWNPAAFLHSVAMLQFHQPPRPDALSFLSSFAPSVPSSVAAILPFVAAGSVLWLASRRLPQSASSFCLAIAASSLLFFALNKQAFCNYYHFVLAAECAALASISEAKSAII